ncbi:hypothetical protein [Streptomyces sp. NPDC053079]|uniref:hypothetical protein n=1 Tax=Streptomyces sp. NPDC053079 TaxID=3365697 RepID=UPI0037CFC683
MALTTGSASVAVPMERVTLTNSDDGRTIASSLGDDIEVRLTSYRESGLTYTWSIPASSGSKVLRSTGGRTTPEGGASAVFHVQGSGAATISAQRRCHPDHGRICPLVIVPWRVKVQVK